MGRIVRKNKITFIGAGLLLGVLTITFGICWYIFSYKNSLKSWLGEYTFSEGYSEPGYAPLAMEYYLKIYEDNDKYYADIEIDGNLTMTRIRAELAGDKNWISLLYLCSLQDNMFVDFYSKNSVLLSLKKDDAQVYTYWGEIQPMLLVI